MSTQDVTLTRFFTVTHESSAYYASHAVRPQGGRLRSKPGRYQPKSYHFFRFNYVALRGAHLPSKVLRGPFYLMWCDRP